MHRQALASARSAGRAVAATAVAGTPSAPALAAAAILARRRRRCCRPATAAADNDNNPSSSTPTPLTPEDLVRLSEQRATDQDAAQRARLRAQAESDRRRANAGFGTGAAGAEQAYWQRVSAAVRDTKFEDLGARAEGGAVAGLADVTNQFPAAMAAEMVALGTWRLRGSLDPAIELAAAKIEALVRELIDDELALYPPNKWKAKGWDYMDTEDPNNERWGGWAHVDAPDPKRGEQRYPRLQVENRAYCSRVFRKLHLELARRQDGLFVLHAVFYPRLDFDVPIFAMDLVAAGGSVSLAIVDVCPVRAGLALPAPYAESMARLQREHMPWLVGDGGGGVGLGSDAVVIESGGGVGGGGARAPTTPPTTSQRTIPDWGLDILSPLCVCVRPRSGTELAAFIEYAASLCRAYLTLAQASRPLDRTTRAGASRLLEVAEGHRCFCERQLANAKTARVLEAAFGTDFTREYMRGLMFDFDPSDAPPWFDPSVTRLHSYLTKQDPVEWSDLERAQGLRQANMGGRSQATLQGVAMFGAAAARRATDRGGPAGARLDEAVQWLVDTDPNFKRAAERLGGGDLVAKAAAAASRGSGGGGGGGGGGVAAGLAEMLREGPGLPGEEEAEEKKKKKEEEK
jgi:phycocyanobilin:ferredoxin oxidoreductase